MSHTEAGGASHAHRQTALPSPFSFSSSFFLPLFFSSSLFTFLPFLFPFLPFHLSFPVLSPSLPSFPVLSGSHAHLPTHFLCLPVCLSLQFIQQTHHTIKTILSISIWGKGALEAHAELPPALFFPHSVHRSPALGWEGSQGASAG